MNVVRILKKAWKFKFFMENNITFQAAMGNDLELWNVQI
jgi:hypothetical protein